MLCFSLHKNLTQLANVRVSQQINLYQMIYKIQLGKQTELISQFLIERINQIIIMFIFQCYPYPQINKLTN